jgi:hypothetical protein
MAVGGGIRNRMHGANAAFLRLNLAPATCSPPLLVVSLLPFPTKLLAELLDFAETGTENALAGDE